MKSFKDFCEQIAGGEYQANTPQQNLQQRTQSLKRATQINRQMRMRAHDELHAHQANVKSIEGQRFKKT